MSHPTIANWLLLFQLESTCRVYREQHLTKEERHVLGYCMQHLIYPPIEYLNLARIEIVSGTPWWSLSPLAKWLSMLRLCTVAAIVYPCRWPATKPADATVLALSFPFNQPFSHELYDGYTYYFKHLSTPLSVEATCAVIIDGYRLWHGADHCA